MVNLLWCVMLSSMSTGQKLAVIVPEQEANDGNNPNDFERIDTVVDRETGMVLGFRPGTVTSDSSSVTSDTNSDIDIVSLTSTTALGSSPESQSDNIDGQSSVNSSSSSSGGTVSTEDLATRKEVDQLVNSNSTSQVVEVATESGPPSSKNFVNTESSSTMSSKIPVSSQDMDIDTTPSVSIDGTTADNTGTSTNVDGSTTNTESVSKNTTTKSVWSRYLVQPIVKPFAWTYRKIRGITSSSSADSASQSVSEKKTAQVLSEKKTPQRTTDSAALSDKPPIPPHPVFEDAITVLGTFLFLFFEERLNGPVFIKTRPVSFRI